MVDELIYSKEALEAKATFYNKDFSIYVEGKDDVIFWDTICKYANLKNYHIEDVGGEPINYYKNVLEKSDADFLVACDLNFHQIKKTKKLSKKIIYTYGHSIENTMYNHVEKIDQSIKKYSKGLKSHRIEIELAIKELGSKIQELILYDIANEIFNKSIPVLTNSCQGYLLVTHSYQLCDTKINQRISKIKHLFDKHELDYCELRVIKLKKDIWFYIRGHFLTTWIFKLIKTIAENSSGIKVDISYDSIYAEFVECHKAQEDVKFLTRQMRDAAFLLN